MKKFFLYGKLGKEYGRQWTLNVKTVPEGIQAIDANAPGFCDYLLQQELKGVEYFITTKKASRVSSSSQVFDKSKVLCTFEGDEVHICPMVAGGMFTILGTAMLGATAGSLVGAAAWGAFALGFVTTIAATLLIGAIVNSLIDTPTMGDPISTKSYIFQGAQNVKKQGIPVPIGYGRLKVGSSTIQDSLFSKDLGRSTNSHLLESFDQIEIYDLISEGPIEGIVNANGQVTYDIEQGVYLNGQPVKNPPAGADDGKGNPAAEGSGTYNYVINEGGTPIRINKGGIMDRLALTDSLTRKRTSYNEILVGPNPTVLPDGATTLDQARRSEANKIAHYIEDRYTTKAVFNLSITCFKQVSSVDQPIVSNLLDFAMQIYDGEKYVTWGDNNWKVEFRKISLSSMSSGEANKDLERSEKSIRCRIDGIATSTYKFEITVTLPPARGKGLRWVEIIRLTEEQAVDDAFNSFSSNLNFVTEWKKYSLQYPHCAVAMVKFDSKNLSAMPKREYHCKLLKIPIPSNYNPSSREYSGIWDGLFLGQRDSFDSVSNIPDRMKRWTNNPAWIFYDLATNERYGLAKYGVGISEELIDKWSIYKAAKYCDELVETGFGAEKRWRNFMTGTVSQQLVTVAITDMVTWEKLSVKQFKEEYGNGSSFKGKKVVFGVLDEFGKRNYQERAIHSSNAKEGWVKVFGPRLHIHGDQSETVGIAGECVCQFNFPIVEPRFTCNIYITEFQEALQLFKNLCSIFQSMVAYIDGRVGVVQENEREPVMMFNNSSVDREGFSYTGIDRNNRKTAVTVRYNNKYANFKQEIAYEEDSPSIDRFGYNEASLVGVGITSPGQAKRLARFYLYVSQLETESVQFKTSTMGAYLKAGDIIEVSDSNRQERYSSGRIKSIDTSARSIVVDKNINKPTIGYYGYEIVTINHQPNETYDSVTDHAMFQGGEVDQKALIDNMHSPQFSRFVGKLRGKNTFGDLRLKKNFSANVDARQFQSYNHGLQVGDEVLFDSDGSLPQPLLPKNIYTVCWVSDSGHWFKVKIGGRVIVPQNDGQDAVENEGGLHYVIHWSNDASTTKALTNVSPGAAWSIANNKLLEPEAEGSGYELNSEEVGEIISQVQNLEAINDNDVKGWYHSDKFGSFYIPRGGKVCGWVYLAELGWIYISGHAEAASGGKPGFWYYLESMASWIWTKYNTYEHFIYSNLYPELDHKWITIRYPSGQGRLPGGVAFVRENTGGALHSNAVCNDGSKPIGSYIGPWKILGKITNEGFWLNIGVKDVSESALDNMSLPSGDPSTQFAAEVGEITTSSDPIIVKSIGKSIYVGEDGDYLVQIAIDKGHSLNSEDEIVVVSTDTNLVNFSGYQDIKRIGITNEGYDVFLILGSSMSSLAGSLIGSSSEVTEGVVIRLKGETSEKNKKMHAQKYRIKGIKEGENNVYEIVGTEYNPSKFASIEKNVNLQKPRAYIPPQADMTIPMGPEDLELFDITYRPE